jgi:hypothetical protein
MLVITLCVGVGSIIGGAFLARKIASPKTAKVLLQPATPVILVEEQTALAKMLIQELDRMEKSEQCKADDLTLVVKSLEIIIRTAWPLGTFYDRRTITPFLRVVHTSAVLEQENISTKYLNLLRDAIRVVASSAIDSLTRGEKGDDINDFTFNVMKKVEEQTKLIEAYNGKHRVSL